MNMQSRTARLVFLALAIIGLISILGLAIWGTVRLATSLNNANPFSRLAVFIASVTLKKEIIRQDLVINASPSMVETGQEVALSWQSNINVGMLGAYVLTYPCNTGVTLKLPSNDTISCDAAFNLWSKTEITLIPTLTVENPVDLAITIAFVPQGATASTMNRTIAVTVTPLEKPATTDKPKTSATNPTTLTPGAETRSTYSINGNITPGTGAADLAISIVDTGIINDATKILYQQALKCATLWAFAIWRHKAQTRSSFALTRTIKSLTKTVRTTSLQQPSIARTNLLVQIYTKTSPIVGDVFVFCIQRRSSIISKVTL